MPTKPFYFERASEFLPLFKSWDLTMYINTVISNIRCS